MSADVGSDMSADVGSGMSADVCSGMSADASRIHQGFSNHFSLSLMCEAISGSSVNRRGFVLRENL
jgi:hypothetical protein